MSVGIGGLIAGVAYMKHAYNDLDWEVQEENADEAKAGRKPTMVRWVTSRAPSVRYCTQ